MATDTGDHRIWLDIDGSTNTTNLYNNEMMAQELQVSII